MLIPNPIRSMKTMTRTMARGDFFINGSQFAVHNSSPHIPQFLRNRRALCGLEFFLNRRSIRSLSKNCGPYYANRKLPFVTPGEIGFLDRARALHLEFLHPAGVDRSEPIDTLRHCS